MRAKTVEQTRTGVGEIAVEDLVGLLRQLYARDLASAGRVEQAEVDLLGVGGEHREVDPEPVPGRAERIGRTAFERGHPSLLPLAGEGGRGAAEVG